MATPILVVVLGICFYITILNYSFQRSKYRGLPAETIKKLNVFNSPTAWLIYSLLIGAIILVILWNTFAGIITAISSMNLGN